MRAAGMCLHRNHDERHVSEGDTLEAAYTLKLPETSSRARLYAARLCSGQRVLAYGHLNPDDTPINVLAPGGGICATPDHGGVAQPTVISPLGRTYNGIPLLSRIFLAILASCGPISSYIRLAGSKYGGPPQPSTKLPSPVMRGAATP
jgi:hypothetical protein